MSKMLLTVEEAADRLSIGRTKVYELVANGELGSVTIGRCRRIEVEAVAAFIDRLTGRTRPHCDERDVASVWRCACSESPAQPGTPRGLADN